MGKRRYGKDHSFGPLEHEPTNEFGVIMLFALVGEELGYRVVHLHAGFPDVELRRISPDGTSEKLEGEFEFLSSNFEKHKHETSRCDIVICWQHDWKECPLPVIELSHEVRKIMAKWPRQRDGRLHAPTRDHDAPETRFSARKKPETVFPENFEPVLETAKRIAVLLHLDEEAVYQQLWRNRNILPLSQCAKITSASRKRGRQGSHEKSDVPSLQLKLFSTDALTPKAGASGPGIFHAISAFCVNVCSV